MSSKLQLNFPYYLRTVKNAKWTKKCEPTDLLKSSPIYYFDAINAYVQIYSYFVINSVFIRLNVCSLQ